MRNFIDIGIFLAKSNIGNETANQCWYNRNERGRKKFKQRSRVATMFFAFRGGRFANNWRVCVGNMAMANVSSFVRALFWFQFVHRYSFLLGKKEKKEKKKNMHDVTWWFNVMFSGKFMKRDNLFIHFVRGTIIEIILFRVVKPDKFKYADSVAFPRNRIQEVDRDAFISYIYTYVCNYEADAKWNEVGCIVNTL